MFERREFLALAGAAAIAPLASREASAQTHQNSLSLPAVQAAIAKGRPMIAGFSNRVETVPLGGYGLPKPPQR